MNKSIFGQRSTEIICEIVPQRGRALSTNIKRASETFNSLSLVDKVSVFLAAAVLVGIPSAAIFLYFNGPVYPVKQPEPVALVQPAPENFIPPPTVQKIALGVPSCFYPDLRAFVDDNDNPNDITEAIEEQSRRIALGRPTPSCDATATRTPATTSRGSEPKQVATAPKVETSSTRIATPTRTRIPVISPTVTQPDLFPDLPKALDYTPDSTQTLQNMPDLPATNASIGAAIRALVRDVLVFLKKSATDEELKQLIPDGFTGDGRQVLDAIARTMKSRGVTCNTRFLAPQQIGFSLTEPNNGGPAIIFLRGKAVLVTGHGSTGDKIPVTKLQAPGSVVYVPDFKLASERPTGWDGSVLGGCR